MTILSQSIEPIKQYFSFIYNQCVITILFLLWVTIIFFTEENYKYIFLLNIFISEELKLRTNKIKKYLSHLD